MQCANRDSRRRRGGERQLLFHDVVLAERDHEEHAEEPSADRERDKLSDVLLRERRQEVQTIHRRDRRDEEDANTTCRRRGGLDGTVLLGTERTAQKAAEQTRFWDGLGQRLDDCISEDGLGTPCVSMDDKDGLSLSTLTPNNCGRAVISHDVS